MTTLQELLKSDSELASLPEIYLRVAELLENERANAQQIGAVVETDPALTTRILKLVNSAFYGLPREIASVAQAISILGRDSVRQILLGSVIGGVFTSFDNDILSLNDFWLHSVKTALLARYMAQSSELEDIAEPLFTAGLLHRIGSLILAHKLPDESSAVRQAIHQEAESLTSAEKRIIGFTHCDTGAAFIRHWGLPPLLASAAQYYLAPRQAPEHMDVVKLIFMAHCLAFFDDVIEQDKIVELLEHVQGWRELGLSLDKITDACVQADQQVFVVMDALGMNSMIIET